jgi:broad specificity phosphatase PhoE
MPDNQIPLTDLGVTQARNVGLELAEVINDSVLYHSPFLRTQQTMKHLLDVNGIKIEDSWEDPRLREVDVGTGKFHEDLRARRDYGWFYYKFPNGESPAMVYDRVSPFVEEMFIDNIPNPFMGGRDVLIVSHGMGYYHSQRG